MRQALASKDMGVVLRAYRRHPAHGVRHLPQHVVARWLGITQGQLSRIESGRNRVRDLERLVDFARRLRIPAEQLWFDVADSDPDWLRVDGLAELPDGAAASDTRVPPEPALAESLLRTLQQYVATDNLAGPHSVLRVAAEHSRFTESLLTRSRGRSRRDLLHVAARYAEFTGWLHQDVGDLRAAMHWSNMALDMANEGSDTRLVSYIQMRKSNIAGDARKTELTISLAGAALQNEGVLTPSLKAVAMRQQAYGHALTGDYDACARTLDRAYTYAARVPGDETDIARYCTRSYVEMEAAHCWVELGMPRRALATLRGGLASWPPDLRRDLGLRLARHAVAHAGAGNPTEALAVAQQSLAFARETGSARTKLQLYRIPALLGEAGAHEDAQQLRHTLRTVLR